MDENFPAWMGRTKTTTNPISCIQALLAQSGLNDASLARVATLAGSKLALQAHSTVTRVACATLG